MHKNPLITFINNIRYLFRYNLKEIYSNQKSSININEAIAFSQKIKCELKNEWNDIFIPKSKNTMETCMELANSNKSIIRLGDGEFMLITGKDIPFQKYDENLAKKLKQIFKINDANLLIGGPVEYYSYIPNLRNSVKEFLYFKGGEIFSNIKNYYNPETTYYSTTVSQVFPVFETYDFEKHFNLFKSIFNNKKITVITGEWIKRKIDHNIFLDSNALSIDYIYGPSANAYNEYENLKKKIEKTPKDNILIFALGPAGKILAYDMYNIGYRVLDLGHIIKDYDAYKKQKTMDNKNMHDFFAPDI